MEFSHADRVWNRAALENGGVAPREGDEALANLLLFHGLVCNGGVHHALECCDETKTQSAVRGFEYFGLTEVASLLNRRRRGLLAKWTGRAERKANARYNRLLPHDDVIEMRFKERLRASPEAFAPLADDVDKAERDAE